MHASLLRSYTKITGEHKIFGYEIRRDKKRPCFRISKKCISDMIFVNHIFIIQLLFVLVNKIKTLKILRVFLLSKK